METATARRPSGPVLSIAHFRSASPTRVKLPSAAGARSPATSVSVSSPPSSSSGAGGRSRRSCMCSPTNHPGSFRCSLHKERNRAPGGHGHSHSKPVSPPSPGGHGQSKLGTKQRMGSAMARLVAVEGGGQWARRALAPSSAAAQQSQHRRRVGGFRPRPSRLSAVSMAGDRASDKSHQGN